MKGAKNEGLFQSPKSEGTIDIVGLLKACGRQKDLCRGSKIHAYIRGHESLQKNCYVASSLVSMYARCGALEKAQQVLSDLPVGGVVVWNALISGYVEQGQGKEALKCFHKMQQEGHSPTEVTFICALKACGSIGALTEGEKMHDKILSLGMLKQNVALGNTLVDMYARCGALAKAQRLVNKLPVRNVITWTALIAGYVQQGQSKEALKCFDDMQFDGHSPDAIAFIWALKTCGDLGAAAKGEAIHDDILHLGLLDKDIVLGSTLVDMYAKCGSLAKAHQVLDGLPVRDVFTWTALIAGYTQQGRGEEALKCFDRMEHEGHSPDVVTYMSALKACGSIGAITKGEKIHKEIVKLGLLEMVLELRSSLVDMYARCGALTKAQIALNELPVRDLVSYTALIAGYTQHGQGEEALRCFESMENEGHSPDACAFVCVLKACGITGSVAKGEMIHDKIVRLGMLKKDTILGSALVDMYARCGALAKAQQVHDELLIRDVVTWTTLIAGYVEQGKSEEALICFDKMESEGHTPNRITFICTLKACGSIGAATKGEKIHDKIVKLGMLEKDNVVGNALVDMYAKCAAFARAVEVLKEFPFQDVVTWNALLGGYAQHGQSEKAIDCFQRMQSRGFSLDSTSLVCVLSACSHAGLVDQAQTYFRRMSTEYGITPDVKHYCCMVDLFARARTPNKALIMIEKMPCADYLPVWLDLLGACCKLGDVEIGRLAFDHVLLLDEGDAAAYVSMTNIYTAAGMYEDAQKIDALRVAHEACVPGCCWWTNAAGLVCIFSAGKETHAEKKLIDAKLKDLVCKASKVFFPSVSKKDVLCACSEKLAIAHALITAPSGTSIFVTKNGQVCLDCHKAIVVLSKIENREIKVRDVNCLHVFGYGKCSCGKC